MLNEPNGNQSNYRFLSRMVVNNEDKIGGAFPIGQ